MKKIGKCKLYRGDCLKVMKKIKDKSIDLVLCDLPYEVLNKSNNEVKWDKIIPLKKLWKHYKRIIKDNGAILLFGQGMFSAKLMMSNKDMWKYNLIWSKGRTTGFLNANKMPLRCHEDIIVFYKTLPTYNPQFEKLNGRAPSHFQGYGVHKNTNQCYGEIDRKKLYIPKKENLDKKFPRSIIEIPKEHDSRQFHPTQKPVKLLEYLIKTYSNENDLVLDNTMGSGSTGVACQNLNRKFIGIEKDKNYFKKAYNRIKNNVGTF